MFEFHQKASTKDWTRRHHLFRDTFFSHSCNFPLFLDQTADQFTLININQPRPHLKAGQAGINYSETRKVLEKTSSAPSQTQHLLLFYFIITLVAQKAKLGFKLLLLQRLDENLNKNIFRILTRNPLIGGVPT